MTPEQFQQIIRRLDDIEYRLNRFARPDRYIFERTVLLGDTSTSKASFFGATPTGRHAYIDTVTGAGGATNDEIGRAAIDDLRDLVLDLGLIASS